MMEFLAGMFFANAFRGESRGNCPGCGGIGYSANTKYVCGDGYAYGGDRSSASINCSVCGGSGSVR